MALETGGLDAQVEQRMDAYRGNPQQLQQRYGVNKDLMDLLALQQIKKDKEAVVADMQLKMQQQPGTIAQQREQEVLALTKQEMSGTLGQLAANTKGTLDQKQSLQNKNMNKMAQNASKPQLGAGAGLAGLMGGGARPQARPPARPPQGGGVEGMLMARNAQRGAPQGGPVRMAHGGIVSFAGADGNNEVVGTPASRLWERMTSGDPDAAKRRDLERKVQEKYGLLSGFAGNFMPQTDEAREYASQIAGTFRMGSSSLTTEELQTALDADFDPVAVTAETVDDLPVFSTEDGTTTDPVETLSVEEVEAQVSSDNPITYESTYVNPQDVLSDALKADTSYTPEIATMPSTAGMAKAEDNLTAAANRTADTNILNIDPLKMAELKPVDAPFSPQDQERYNAMMKIYEDDAMIDSEGVGKTARADSDAHLRRAENDADFRRMSKEEKELQARLFSPAQLASEARIATFGGAARGRGGMSAAYTDIMGKQRAGLTDALGRLREIDQDRISGDLSTAQTSSARGSEAANRAASKRAGGLGGIAADFAAKEKRALQAQALESANIATEYKHQSALVQATYGAAEATNQRNFDALEQIVTGQRTQFDALVDLAISATTERNTAAAKNRENALEQLLEIAKSKAEYAFKDGELASKNVLDLEGLRTDSEEKASELTAKFMSEDPRYIALAEKMMDMAGAEDSPEFKKLVKQAEILYKSYMGAMIAIAPGLFGEQEALKEFIAAARAGTPYSRGTLSRDTSVIPLDSPSTGPR